MIKAIVYESKTGFTKKYAELLAKETGLPCYSFSENKVAGGESIIFMGWLCAGKIKGYGKASKKYSVRAVAGVGMRSQDASALSDLIKQNSLGTTPAFYLQGGIDLQKLRGLSRIILKIAVKAMSGEAKEGDTESANTADMLQNGRNYVSLDKLSGLLDWYRNVV